MTSAYILILAILVLGGLLATLGDRLGTKVGKARLSLFKLRPKQTATVVTIITGTIISASTLGILFATSKSLRVGIFQLDEKLKELRQARQELTEVTLQKTEVEQQLAKAEKEQSAAQKKLDAINQYLQQAINRQSETAVKLNQAESKLSQVETEFQRAKTQLGLIESQYQRAQSQLATFSEQAQNLRREIQKLQKEQQELLRQKEEVQLQIAQRDQEIAQREAEIEKRDREIIQQQLQIGAQEREIKAKQSQIDQQTAQIKAKQSQIDQQTAEIDQQKQQLTDQQQEIERRQAEIAQRDQVIAERENRLKQLERQQAFLEKDIQNLEQNFQFLREGNFAILKNQVLASGVVRVLQPLGARQAAEELLREANLAAIQRIRPGTNAVREQVVQITATEFERLVEQISSGEPYVVRILSSANYLVGERIVQVFADAALNKIVFYQGEILAGTSVSPATMTDAELRERIDLLLASASFRARRAGILSEPIQIAEGRLTLLEFIQELKQYNQEVIVQAIVSDVTYTSGPLKINLVVVQNGEMLNN